VDQLRHQLEQQEEEANEAIASWESKALEFEKDLETNVANFRELDNLREKTLKALEDETESLKTKLRDLESELEKTAEDRNRLRDALGSKSTEKLEDERDRLTIVAGQLEEELRIANDMIQTYVTDEAAEKATEFASYALRDEIDELKCHIDEYKHQIESEMLAREVAELEIERLRDDITTLASLTNPGGRTDDLQLRTAKAAEKLKRKERIEIEELRNSLYRGLDEVETARAAEREALQNLSKIRLQTSVCEQEIVAAKSEIHFLTQALEDLHLAEESKGASLEYRIGSLEDENDLLRKYHAGELEDAQHELSQVTMEKDRTVHQLRELEKTNAALVYAASKEKSDDSKDGNDLEDDIAKLRVANAHLLTVACDDKARAERKLREVLSAQMASTEADAILEHELRVNAEQTIRSLKFQLEELKKAGSRPSNEETSRTVHNISESTTKQIESLQQEIKQLIKENSTMKMKIEKEAAKAKAFIDKLTEECGKAQSKLHKAQRDGRFDAAVKSEASRLRMSPMVSTPERRDDVLLLKAAPESSDTSKNAAAFDLIQKHKEEIQEERRMYMEFLAEHDDLLALLAQQDLERICLREELSNAGGQAAVDRALQRAEEKTVSQYGKIIRLAQSP
jgi:DNA repair exonuclease SbcCD ATPase subunit